ncbi:MAG TPA: Hsp70 family protein [Acidimicrobiales bacterium]|nr:Hsp70 family protein [Acidimicrobiales bacterium]
MTYHLGVDLGTTYTCAAVHENGRLEVVPLGQRGPSIPSVLYLREEGDLLAGDAAERHAVTAPERIAREFKRRLGDPTPMTLGGAAARPEVLTGNLLRWAYETVVRQQGRPPDTLALTHPANWGSYKLDLFAASAEVAGLTTVTMVTEPQAAAVSYASEERVDPGAVVAVYDLGGGTFDAAALRKEADGGFTLLGTPDGIERLGGIDFDAAVFAHVAQSLDGALEDLDPDDEAAIAAVARLRLECTQAKEALSSDSEATIPVLLPNVQSDVRLTRDQFEEMIRPTLAETVTALERALRSAEVRPADVDHVLLVGGSSRIPLVGQLVSAGIGRPVAVDAHPKHAIALGAAHVATRAAGVATVDAHTRSTQAVGGGAALPPPPAGITAPPRHDPTAGTVAVPPSTPPAPEPSMPGRSVFDAAPAAAAGPTNPDPDATVVFQDTRRPLGPPPATPPSGGTGSGGRHLPPPPSGPSPGRPSPSSPAAGYRPAAPQPATPARPAPPRPAPRPQSQAPPRPQPQPSSGHGYGPPPGYGQPASGQGYGPRPGDRQPASGQPSGPGYGQASSGQGYGPPPGYGQAPTGQPSGPGSGTPYPGAGHGQPPGYGSGPSGQGFRQGPGYGGGYSQDLPPGIVPPEQRAAQQAKAARKQKLTTAIGTLIFLLVIAAAVAAVVL